MRFGCCVGEACGDDMRILLMCWPKLILGGTSTSYVLKSINQSTTSVTSIKSPILQYLARIHQHAPLKKCDAIALAADNGPGNISASK